MSFPPIGSVQSDGQMYVQGGNYYPQNFSVEDDINFHGVAKNLLDIRNSAKWETDNREDPSIVKFFEPKFMQVFASYNEYMKKTVDTSGHLMGICLENLIPFCCWARENVSRISWMKAILDDNVDLRPEVRNGLAMVLIYTMATAKSSLAPDRDMFMALQDPDFGFGIVNKTSLKIYNDPFNFFNFLKSCMSGLIDAGKIPENERQNQPKKPAKKLSENREELLAFMQMNSILCALFTCGDVTQARAKIQQISDAWQDRHKSIRNKWFLTAMAIQSAPNQLNAGTALNASFYQNFNGNYNNVPQYAPPLLPGSGPGSLSDSTSSQQQMSGLPPPLMPLNYSYHMPLDANGSVNGSSGLGLPSSSSYIPSSIPPISTAPMSDASSMNQTFVTTPSAMNNGSSGSSQDFINNDNYGARSTSSSGDEAGQIASQKTYRPLATSEPLSVFTSNKTPRASFSSTPSASNGLNMLAPLAPIVTMVAARAVPSVPAMRFERVGGREWDCKENRIYNIESIVLQNSCVFCLIDESKLTQEERTQKKFRSTSAGLVSMQAELQQRGALITSWPKTDHNHLLDFLEAWMTTQSPETSLIDFWNSHSVNTPRSIAFGAGNCGQPQSSSSTLSSRGCGMLSYELLMQIGIVLRKNEDMGISEDCWRLMYPQELLSNATGDLSFGAFLCRFFPQLRVVFAKLGGGSSDLSNVVVKYFPHKIEPPATQPPRPEDLNAYQTIGTLDEQCFNILSRFDTGTLSFHDIVFMLI